MVDSLSPAQALPLLLPYADVHKNPKVRGKAGSAVAAAVARMPPADVAAYGLPRLLQLAGKLVTGAGGGWGCHVHFASADTRLFWTVCELYGCPCCRRRQHARRA